MIDYSKLVVRPSLKWWIRYKFLKSSAHLVERFPIIGKASRFIGYRFVNFANSGASFKSNSKYVDLLNKDDQNANHVGSPYGYGEIKEIMTAVGYHAQLMDKNFGKLRSESPVLYKEAVETVTKLLKTDPEITKMLDFGVAYGHMNAVWASQFRDKEFIGVDRSPFVKFYNDQFFQDLKNLSFHAGDVFDLMRSKKFENGIFFHARTMLCLPPSFVRKLYQNAFNVGFKYIVGFEQVGVSRQTDKAYSFSESPQPSVFFRDFMYMHNYPCLLKECGFSVHTIDLIKTNNLHEDLRILRFIAKRV